MSRLEPKLLELLSNRRIVPRRVTASVGIGERPSRDKGRGIEFEDYRPYQPGDDLKFVDAKVFSRTGRPFVKEFATYKQLSVVLLLDGSRSMSFGKPPKIATASALSEALAFIALSAGDVLRLATLTDHLRVFPSGQGERTMPSARQWIESARGVGAGDVRRGLRSLVRHGVSGSLVIIVSDFQSEGVEEALTGLAKAGAEIAAVHVMSPEDLDPRHATSGAVRMIDSETGEVIDAVGDPSTTAYYQQELSAWKNRLSAAVNESGGRYLQVSSTTAIEEILLRTWRAEGLLA